MGRFIVIAVTFFIFIPLIWKLMDWIDSKIEKVLEKHEDAKLRRR